MKSVSIGRGFAAECVEAYGRSMQLSAQTPVAVCAGQSNSVLEIWIINKEKYSTIICVCNILRML